MRVFQAQLAPSSRGRLSKSLLALAILFAVATGCHSRSSHKAPEVQLLTTPQLKTKLSGLRDPVTLVHVWATWCAPCREEFPHLMRFQKDYANRGVTLILISADSPDKKDQVASYLAEQGVSSSSYIIDNPNAAFIDALCTNWSGAMPASFFFGAGAQLKDWWEGEAAYEKYADAAKRLVK